MIQKPCIGICKLNDKIKLCCGCYRTRLEIVTWDKLSDEAKLVLLGKLKDRKEIFGDIKSDLQ